MRAPLVSLSALLFQVQAGAGFAQRGAGPAKVTISPSARCATCTIRQETVVTLGAAGDPVRIGALSVVAHSPRGFWLVSSENERSIIVFDSTGRFIRTFGSGGYELNQFPNRISGIVVSTGDSVLAWGGSHFLTFSPTFEFVRSGKAQVPSSALLSLPDNQFLVRGSVAGDTFPLHILSPNATGLTLVRSFGFPGPAMEPIPLSPASLVALSPDRAVVWLGSKRDAVSAILRGWAIDGSKRAEVVIPTDGWSTGRILAVDPADVVWVSMATQRTSSTGGTPETLFVAGPPLVSYRNVDPFSGGPSANITAYDVVRGQALGTLVLEGHATPVIGANLTALHFRGADQVVHVRVLRLSVAGR